MARKEEFESVKNLIKKKIEDFNLGLFFTRNTCGDVMTRIFTGEYFKVDVCEYWCYFEVFGCEASEREELEKYYTDLGGCKWKL